MIACAINGAMGLINYLSFLQLPPEIITPDHVAFFPVFDPETIQQQLNLVYQVAGGAAYVLTWIGTVMLLKPCIRRVGRAY